MDDVADALARLDAVLDDLAPAAVAVSGGVDSMTLAVRAHAHLGNPSPARLGNPSPARLGNPSPAHLGNPSPAHLGRGVQMFHATSPAVPDAATERVRAFAERQGWSLEIFDAGEFDDPIYRANPVNRCFYCKTDLYGAMRRRTDATLLSGTNRDDLGDYRPGLEAARDRGVRHPYVEADIDKTTVRALARALGHPDLAALPAQPCLSSRVETGLLIRPRVLAVVDAVERFVAGHLAPDVVRCRVRRDEICIELDAGSLQRLQPEDRSALGRDIAAMFAGVGVDCAVAFAPYRMGSAFIGAPKNP